MKSFSFSSFVVLLMPSVPDVALLFSYSMKFATTGLNLKVYVPDSGGGSCFSTPCKRFSNLKLWVRGLVQLGPGRSEQEPGMGSGFILPFLIGGGFAWPNSALSLLYNCRPNA